MLRQFGYAYDAVGNITNVVADTGASRGYAYDELDRLTEETVVTGSSTNRVSWAYDLAGNRTRMTQGSTTNAYTLGTGNRLATWGANGENGYAYDAAGCVTQRVAGAKSLGLEWDAQYRLTAVRDNGAAVETYGYDALGRRVWTASGSVTNYYAYDGAQVVADLDANGQVVRSYIHAPGIDRLLAIVVHGAVTTKYACLTDHLGTVHALADEAGNIVETYEYDAWGNVLAVRDGAGNPLTESAIGNRFLFQGREYSWATGLYNFRARWYDPETGRWLSNDPIGISGGLNQYCFCANNPVNFTDPYGLCEGGNGWDDLRGIQRTGHSRGVLSIVLVLGVGVQVDISPEGISMLPARGLAVGVGLGGERGALDTPVSGTQTMNIGIGPGSASISTSGHSGRGRVVGYSAQLGRGGEVGIWETRSGLGYGHSWKW